MLILINYIVSQIIIKQQKRRRGLPRRRCHSFLYAYYTIFISNYQSTLRQPAGGLLIQMVDFPVDLLCAFEHNTVRAQEVPEGAINTCDLPPCRSDRLTVFVPVPSIAILKPSICNSKSIQASFLDDCRVILIAGVHINVSADTADAALCPMLPHTAASGCLVVSAFCL